MKIENENYITRKSISLVTSNLDIFVIISTISILMCTSDDLGNSCDIDKSKFSSSDEGLYYMFDLFIMASFLWVKMNVAEHAETMQWRRI